MRTTTIGALVLSAALAAGFTAPQVTRIGDPAPAFKATDTKGKTRTLAEFKGKWVVLEWHNNGCPYVKRHYAGNMQKLQREWTARGVVWLTVISSAPGAQGYVSGPEADAYVASAKAAPTAVLLDPKGELGHLYEAKTTPHMFVINPAGALVYNGAIDDKPSSNTDDNATAVNYVSAALTEGLAGKRISIPSSRPYGCAIKYGAGEMKR